MISSAITFRGAVGTPMRVLVIGGTQFIGRSLVEELVKAGHEVHVLHRKPRHTLGKKVHNVVADRNNPESIRSAVGSTRFDVVYDNVYDWERGTTAAQVEATARIFDGRVSRYVFMSSVAAYGDGLNHHEGDALAPDDHPNVYARNKAMTERALFRMHQRTGLPIVTMRPPFVYGPGNPYYREAFFWDRFRAGRPVIVPSDGHRLMQFIYVHDLVDLAIRVAESKNAVGHSFNTAHPRVLSQLEVVTELARVANNSPPRIISIPRDEIYRAGGQVVGDKLYFGDYYDLPAITEVVTKAQRMLAFKPTDFPCGLKAAFSEYQKKRRFPRPNFSFEDDLLQAAFARVGSQTSA